MIVEYKAPSVRLTQEVFDQIARYSLALRVPYLTVSNGLHHYCCRIDPATRRYTFLREIPDYQSINTIVSCTDAPPRVPPLHS